MAHRGFDGSSSGRPKNLLQLGDYGGPLGVADTGETPVPPVRSVLRLVIGGAGAEIDIVSSNATFRLWWSILLAARAFLPAALFLVMVVATRARHRRHSKT